jgi:hypothetical protein
MSQTKRFTGDYTLESVDSGAVVINSDLTVTGTTTAVNTTDLEIVDNTIVLNSGEAGPGITHPDGSAGILIDRGDGVTPGQLPAGIRFNESLSRWEMDVGDDTWPEIAASGGAGITAVVEDTTPELGGNLDVNGKSITSVSNGDVLLVADGTGLVKVDQELTLKEQAAPAGIAGYSKLYAGTAGTGGSGIYYVNDSDGDELVSKSKAMVFGLIF